MSKDSDDFRRYIDIHYDRVKENLESYSEEDMVENPTYSEIYDDGEGDEFYKLDIEDSNDLLSFYISIAALIESESVMMISAHCFAFGLTRKGSYEFVQESFTQSHREDMIFYMGFIDSGLKGELTRVRKRRNELAHSHEHRYVRDIEQELNSVQRAYEAKEKLEKIAVEVELDSV